MKPWQKLPNAIVVEERLRRRVEGRAATMIEAFAEALLLDELGHLEGLSIRAFADELGWGRTRTARLLSEVASHLRASREPVASQSRATSEPVAMSDHTRIRDGASQSRASREPVASQSRAKVAPLARASSSLEREERETHTSPEGDGERDPSPAASKSRRSPKEDWIAEAWALCRAHNGRLGAKAPKPFRAALGGKGGAIDCGHAPADLAQVYEWALVADHPRAQYLRAHGNAHPTTCARHLSDYLEIMAQPPAQRVNGAAPPADGAPQLSAGEILAVLRRNLSRGPQRPERYDEDEARDAQVRAALDQLGGWTRYRAMQTRDVEFALRAAVRRPA